MTARGIPTARGASWRAASIRNILRSPRIAGLRVRRGEGSLGSYRLGRDFSDASDQVSAP
ncbi:recombinase family protein [Pseudarthrobacter oxydans]|uniref:recombinase family protein n=1 Tax=Pseudarthrobacter oxydans TaxID=1671 RepID=UPI00380FB0E3